MQIYKCLIVTTRANHVWEKIPNGHTVTAHYSMVPILPKHIKAFRNVHTGPVHVLCMKSLRVHFYCLKGLL